MLLSYSFQNYQSFKSRVDVSLELNNKVSARGWEATSKGGQRVSTALAVFGANGAGKTALLKPLAFAIWFMRSSFSRNPDKPIAITPHFNAADDPTEIEIEAEDHEGVRWKYVLHATPSRVLHEALYRKKERFSYVFVRSWNESKDTYDIKQQGFDLSASEAKKTRANASMISTALQYGVPLARHLTSFTFASNINYRGRRGFQPLQIRQAAHIFSENESLRAAMSDLLVAWDLGLSGVQIKERLVLVDDEQTEKMLIAVGVHTGASGRQIELPMEEESSGTQSAFVLLSRLLRVLANGGVAAIDEIENDLHPHMVEPVLDLFANPSTNPHCAQLLFTCHSPEVLDLLQKSQVMLVEKNNCESIAYRADQIRGLRSDDNLRAKYMAGALGAVPRL